MASATRSSTWSDYRWRSRRFWSMLLLGLLLALALAEGWLIELFGLHGLVWPVAVWVCAVLWAGHRLQAFLCPRCNHRFFHRSPPLLPIRAERCVHCMLSKD